jgi:hypothetical protein
MFVSPFPISLVTHASLTCEILLIRKDNAHSSDIHFTTIPSPANLSDACRKAYSSASKPSKLEGSESDNNSALSRPNYPGLPRPLLDNGPSNTQATEKSSPTKAIIEACVTKVQTTYRKVATAIAEKQLRATYDKEASEIQDRVSAALIEKHKKVKEAEAITKQEEGNEAKDEKERMKTEEGRNQERLQKQYDKEAKIAMSKVSKALARFQA